MSQAVLRLAVEVVQLFLKVSLWRCRVAGPGLTGPKEPGPPGELGPVLLLPEGGT